MNYIHSRLDSSGILREFNNKWTISIQGCSLKDSLYNSIHRGLYASKCTFSRISEWSYAIWAISVQCYVVKDLLLNMERNQIYLSKAIVLKMSYWFLENISYIHQRHVFGSSHWISSEWAIAIQSYTLRDFL